MKSNVAGLGFIDALWRNPYFKAFQTNFVPHIIEWFWVGMNINLLLNMLNTLVDRHRSKLVKGNTKFWEILKMAG